MKKYTEPKFEIVTIEASDVITASFRTIFTSVTSGRGIEGSGHSNLANYAIGNSVPKAQ